MTDSRNLKIAVVCDLFNGYITMLHHRGRKKGGGDMPKIFSEGDIPKFQGGRKLEEKIKEIAKLSMTGIKEMGPN